jgi:hypothetical protein
MMRSAVVATLALAASTRAEAQAPTPAQICSQVYTGAVMRTQTSDQLNVALQTINSQSCSSSADNSSDEFGASAQAVIKAVPVVGSFFSSHNVSSRKNFCSRYQSGEFGLSTLQTYTLEPVVAAMEQANKCMEIANSANLVVTHTFLDPSSVTLNGHFTSAEERVRISAQTTGGFVCISPRPGSSAIDQVSTSEILRQNADFAITCKRQGIKNGSNIDYVDGAIAINTSKAGTYTVWVKADSIYGATSRRAADLRINQAEEQARLERERADKALSERDALARKTYTPVRFYFGEGTPGIFGGANYGEHFSCDPWSKPQAGWEPEVTGRVCPGGQLINMSRYASHGGNRCGYNYYVAVCEK